jgi:hypothetical protein
LPASLRAALPLVGGELIDWVIKCLAQIDHHSVYPFTAINPEWKEADDVANSVAGDEYVTLMFNDEVHSFDQVIASVRAGVPGCSEAIANDFANRIDKLPGNMAVVRVGTKAECEQALACLRQIDLGAEIQPRTRAVPPINDDNNDQGVATSGNTSSSSSTSTAAWTMVPQQAVFHALDFLLELAADNAMSHLLCGELLALCRGSMVQVQLEPTFTVTGITRSPLPAGADGLTADEVDRRLFATQVEPLIGVEQNTLLPQSRLSFWRASRSTADVAGMFRARIAVPLALGASVSEKLHALVRATSASDAPLKIDSVEVENVNRWRLGDDKLALTRLLALLSCHAGQSDALKEKLGQWYFALWAKDIEFKTHWAVYLVRVYDTIVKELGRSQEPAWSLLSFTIQVFHQPRLTTTLVREHNLFDIFLALVDTPHRTVDEDDVRVYANSPKAMHRVVQDMNRVLRVPGIREWLLAERPALVERLIDAVARQSQRTHANIRQVTHHTEFTDESWYDPLQRATRVTPLLLDFAMPLIRPSDALDVDAPTDSLAHARLLLQPQYAAYLTRALDIAARKVAIVTKKASYDALCSDDEFEATEVPTDMKASVVEKVLRKVHPELPETASFDALLQDANSYRCPICLSRQVAMQHRYKADAIATHIAQEHLALGVSIHCGMQRFVALACRQRVAAIELLQAAGEAVPSAATDIATVLGDDEARALVLLDEPLSVFVVSMETRAGRWRRNANVVPVQLLNWSNVSFRSYFKYLDLLACQTAMCALTPARFVSHVLWRFGVLDWARDTTLSQDDAPAPSEDALSDEKDVFDDDEQCAEFLLRLDSVFAFLLNILEEQNLAAHITLEQRVDDEIVHALFLAPRTHSELCQNDLHYGDRLRDLAGMLSYDRQVGATDEVVKRVLARVATLRPATAQNPAEYVLNADAAQRVSPYHRQFTQLSFEKVVEKHRSLKQPCSLLPEHRPLAGYGPHRQALLASRELATLLRAVLALSQRRGAKTLGALGAALRLARVALRAVPADDAGELHQLASLLAAVAANDVTREFAPTIDAALDAMPASVTAAFRRQPVEDTDAADKASRAKEKRRRMKDKIMERMKKQQAAFVADGDNDGAPGDASATAADTDAPADISAPTAAATAATPKSSAAPLHGAGTAADVNALAQGDAELEAPEDANSCILCRSSSESASPLGTLSLVQRSAVAKHHTHSLWRDAATAPLNGAPTLHAQGALAFELVVTSCGHVVHEACRTGYLESLLASIRSHRAFAGRGLVEPERGEMLCPLCKTKSNLFVPSGAAVSVPAPVPDLRADATDDRDPSVAECVSKLCAALTDDVPTRAPEGDAERAMRDCLATMAGGAALVVRFPIDISDDSLLVQVAADTCDAVELASRTAPLRNADVAALPLGQAGALLRAAVFFGAGAHDRLVTRKRIATALHPSLNDVSSVLLESPVSVWLVVAGALQERAPADAARLIGSVARVLLLAHIARAAACVSSVADALAPLVALYESTAVPPAFGELVNFVGRELAGGHTLSPAAVLACCLPLLRRLGAVVEAVTGNTTVTSTTTTTTTTGSDDDELSSLLHRIGLPSLERFATWCLRDATALRDLLHQWHDAGSSALNGSETKLSGALPVALHDHVPGYGVGAEGEFLAAMIAASATPAKPSSDSAVSTSDAALRDRARACARAAAWRVTPPTLFSLVPLPTSYTDVLRRYARAACNDCHTQPRSVALCLLCGTVLCPGADCCSVNGVGEAHRHARTCGAGLGLMLLVATCDLTLLFHDQLGRVNALYLDEFGDVDHNLVSGRPLSLVTERLRHCTALVVSHTTHHTLLVPSRPVITTF